MMATQPAATPMRILVALGHDLFRSAVATLLDDEPGMLVVSEVSDGSLVAGEVARANPDVVILDTDLGPAGGIAVCSALRAGGTPAKVLVVSERADRELLLASVEAGADGFVTHDAGGPGLVEAILQVRAGQACVPPDMLSVLLRDLIHRRRDEDAVVERFGRLSDRERQVMALVVDGCSNQAIGAALGVSPNTARTHVQNVLPKLQVHSRLELMALAQRHGLVDRFVKGRPQE
jgi:DNA-binding NarL/FixJ family response regulator